MSDVTALDSAEMDDLTRQVPASDRDALIAEIERLGRLRENLKRSRSEVTEQLRLKIVEALRAGVLNESSASRVGHVDRMTVRGWLGK